MWRMGFAGIIVLLTGMCQHSVEPPSPPAAGVHKLAATLRGNPSYSAGIESGDPRQGPSIIVEKFAPGGAVPWHWHTPNEHVMMVQGTFLFEIKGDKPTEINAGDFVLIPSHHLSQTTCVGSEPCINFLFTDAPADIHFVDERGVEISSEQAQQNFAKTHPEPQQ